MAMVWRPSFLLMVILLGAASGPVIADDAANRAVIADGVAFVCAAIGDEQKLASQARELGLTIEQWQVYRCSAAARKAGLTDDELSAALSRLGGRQPRGKPPVESPPEPSPRGAAATPALPAAPAVPPQMNRLTPPPAEISLCRGHMTRDGCQPK